MTERNVRPVGDSARAAEGINSWRTLYLVAGGASVGFILLLIAAITLDTVAPPPVDGGAETLEFIAANKSVYVAEQVLWLLPNMLAVLTFVALFVAVAPTNRSLALIGAVVGGLSWASFLAIPVTSRGSLTLVYLSGRHSEATSDTERARFATAAEAILGENNTPAIVGVLSAAGILLISLAMLHSALPRWIGWLGVAAGVFGVAGEALRQVVPSFYLGYGLLMPAWFLVVRIALVRLGLRTPR
ncbi:DUF4386 family protein [Cryobacterium sp. TMT4-10]|uniref:DUF4386 family protein n=1 Tax=Cryobacterium sp. TMT4-10 TaxID=1259256 RepID=UPI001069746A|nr:DUF4386 family protein [Cryobacterium sp. TMT4-10]TFD18833.1 DUF4386 family protein [Cryobacterium sp. TMT4-10]